MKQKRIIYIITSLQKSNSEDICHDKRETEKNCAGVLLGIADGGGYFKLHNVFRNSPVHLRDETPFHPAGGGSNDSILPALDCSLLFGVSLLGLWIYSHCPGEPGDVPNLSDRRDDCENNLPHLLPTTLVRPVIDADGSFWEQLVALLYRIDSPDNLFPSIHCLESWICFRSARKMKKAPPRYRNVAAVATIMIFASTQLLKQHVLLDVAGAIAAGEMGLLLAHKLYVQREGATV